MASVLLMLIAAACPAQSQPEWATADARTKRELLRACGSVPALPSRTLPEFAPEPAPRRRDGRDPVFGVSLGGFAGKGFFLRPPDYTFTNDVVGGVSLEAWAIVRLGRVELHPSIGCFWVTRWSGPISGMGVAAGLRLRFAWDGRLSSGIGAAAGPGSFMPGGPFAIAYDSDAIFGHLMATLIALRVSPALRIALDAGFTGWTLRYRNRAVRPETEGAMWSRLSAEFLF